MNTDNFELREKTQSSFNAPLSTDSRLYIFVADGMNIGGIETLLVRMANQIAELGYPVVVAAQSGPCLESLGTNVSTFQLAANTPLAAQLKQISIDILTAKTRVFIWAATPYNLVSVFKFQRHLYRKTGAKSVSVSGIFGPTRSVRGLKRRYDMMEHRLVLGWLPKKSVYFMSKAVQNTYIEQFGDSFADWPIHKLALDQTGTKWRPRESNVLKVVSIGRITKFKPYNFGALDVVESLIEKKIAVHWSIWGHGDQSDLLEKAIRDRGLNDYVTFHGALPYSKFKAVAADADLFVGMGTAALEAALMGVPTVVALTWSRLGTYGFLHQCPDDSIGEQCTGHEETSLIDIISSYSDYSAEKRVEIGLLCQQAASRKISDEKAPFDSMFEGGLRYPGNHSASLRMMAFGAAQNVWSIVKGVVNLVKASSRWARANG